MRRAAWMLALCGLVAASGCVALVGGVDVPALEEGADGSTDVGADAGASEGGDDGPDVDAANADGAGSDGPDSDGADAAGDATHGDASADAARDVAIVDAAGDEPAPEAGGDASSGCGPCDTPPQCYALPGACTAGSCSYMPAGLGVPCDAGMCNGSGSCL